MRGRRAEGHICHAPGCGARVPPRMFACRRHWYALPAAYRAAIWAEYRDGQEIDKQPSRRYLAVQSAARARLAFKPHDEQAAHYTAGLMIAANVWRTIAVRAGEGDAFQQLGAPVSGMALATAAQIREVTGQ